MTTPPVPPSPDTETLLSDFEEAVRDRMAYNLSEDMSQSRDAVTRATVDRLRSEVLARVRELEAALAVKAKMLMMVEASEAARMDHIEELRGGQPGPYPMCSDCGRAMVWDTPEREMPVWLCPRCVHQRMMAAEAALAVERARTDVMQAVIRIHVRDNEALRSVLAPFAAMHREGCDPTELACERGVASDMTILTSGHFEQAAKVLAAFRASVPASPPEG